MQMADILRKYKRNGDSASIILLRIYLMVAIVAIIAQLLCNIAPA